MNLVEKDEEVAKIETRILYYEEMERYWSMLERYEVKLQRVLEHEKRNDFIMCAQAIKGCEKSLKDSVWAENDVQNKDIVDLISNRLKEASFRIQ